MKRWRVVGGVVGVAVDNTRRDAAVVSPARDARVARACCCFLLLLVNHLHADPFPPASRLHLATPASSEPAAATSTGRTRREAYAGTVYGTSNIRAQLLHGPYHCHCFVSDDAHPWIQNMQVNTAVNIGWLTVWLLST